MQQRERRMGRRGTIPADEVRGYLEGLRARGMGIARIAKLAGLPPATVQRILGQQTRVWRATAAKLLAVKPSRADGIYVPSWRAAKYIETLLADGFTEDTIKNRTGLTSLILGERVRLGVFRRIERAYKRLTE